MKKSDPRGSNQHISKVDAVCIFKVPKCQNLYWWYDFDDVGVDYMVFWGAYSSDEVFRMIKDKDYGILLNQTELLTKII